MTRFAGVALRASFVGLLALPIATIAQEPHAEQGDNPNAPSFRPGQTLNEQQKRGEYLFLQRCQICHQAKYKKSAAASEVPVFYRSIAGILKDATPARETLVLEQIQRGSMNMPGFRYTLQPQEIDDVIAYLKTL